MANEIDLFKAQLFLDDAWIDEAFFISRQWHQPRKLPDPVLKAEHPWERWAPVLYGTVLYWRDAFHMWYAAFSRETKPRVCYARSGDGIAWEKPVLGVCEFNGNKDNNIVLDAVPPRYIDNLSVIDDPDDTEWPLKALFWEGSGHNIKQPDYGYFAARSKDGIHWDRSLGLVLPTWGDRFNAAAHKIGGKYIVLGRYPQSWTKYGRCVWRTESDDLVNWREAQLVLMHDTQDPVNLEYYSATAFEYESLTLGSIERMHMSPDRLDTELIWSRDAGRTWLRAPHRPAFLSPSTSPHFDDTWVNLSSGGPIRRHNRLWFYYSGRSAGHNVPYPMNHAAVGLATLRVDGFASVFSEQRKGHFVTRPMTWPEADLHINADPRRDLSSHPGFCSGDVRVEVRPPDGEQAIPGFAWDECEPMGQTINSPEACAKVAWRSGKSMRELAGTPIRLAFRLQDAHLYSFRARPATA